MVIDKSLIIFYSAYYVFGFAQITSLLEYSLA